MNLKFFYHVITKVYRNIYKTYTGNNLIIITVKLYTLLKIEINS